MSNNLHDINDDEIRIISSKGEDSNRSRIGRKTVVLWVSAIAIVCLLVALIVFTGDHEGDDNVLELTTKPVENKWNEMAVTESDSLMQTKSAPIKERGYVAIADTVVNRVALTIFTPKNATPTLQIGADVLDDSTAVFVVQAADVRSDNGGIVGAYVKEGELISKGEAKSGFCAIIGGKLTVGVADATPYLEQALESDGYFFRQYPLVVANQVVENKPKRKSLRRALCDWNGQTVVIMSREKMTFHDFAQSLVDLGVANAIYLVGGKGYGFAIGSNGEKTEIGRRLDNMRPNTNYIVWR